MEILEIDCRSFECTSADTPSDAFRHAPLSGHAQAIWHDLPVAAQEVVNDRPALGRLLAMVLSANLAYVLCPGLVGAIIAVGPVAVW